VDVDHSTSFSSSTCGEGELNNQLIKPSMAMRALALPPSQSSSFGLHQSMPCFKPSNANPRSVKAYAKADEEEKKVPKQSLFGNITEALDFSQVRSEKDAELLYEARDSIKEEGRMTREQVYIY
jgi:hypothetical protein